MQAERPGQRTRDDVGFFQAVCNLLKKGWPGEQRASDEVDLAIRQILSKVVAADEVNKLVISIWSDEFLADVRGMPQRNLAVEPLPKRLNGEIKCGSSATLCRRGLSPMLESAQRKYQNRAIETAHVIEELIQLTKDMRDAQARGEALDLSDDEVAFHDVLETNDSAVNCRATPRYAANSPPPCAERHHRLDNGPKRTSATACAGEAHPAQLQVPAG